MKNILNFYLFESQTTIESKKKEMVDLKSMGINDDPEYNDIVNSLKSFLIGKTITYYTTKEDMESKSNPMTMEIKNIFFVSQDPMSASAQRGKILGNFLNLYSTQEGLKNIDNVALTLISPQQIEIYHKQGRNLHFTNPEEQMDYLGPQYIKTKEEPKGAPFGIVYNPNLYKALQSNPKTKEWISFKVTPSKSVTDF